MPKMDSTLKSDHSYLRWNYLASESSVSSVLSVLSVLNVSSVSISLLPREKVTLQVDAFDESLLQFTSSRLLVDLSSSLPTRYNDTIYKVLFEELYIKIFGHNEKRVKAYVAFESRRQQKLQISEGSHGSWLTSQLDSHL
jgi:hypothetical protein